MLGIIFKHDTPNVLVELINNRKSNKLNEDTLLNKWNYLMSPEYKIELIENWIETNKDKWYDDGIRGKDIIDFINKNPSINYEQVYSFLRNNELPVMETDAERDMIRWFYYDKKDINDTKVKFIYDKYKNLSKDFIIKKCKNLNLYYSIIKEWIESLPYKTPTTYDISSFKKKNPIFIDNYIVEDILSEDFNIKVTREIKGFTIIRKPENKYTNDDKNIERFYKKYLPYYIHISTRPSILFTSAVAFEADYKRKLYQIGGKSVECNNTQVLYNSLGSCWNNSIQSIYAFYLDRFDSILDKTGTELYDEANKNGLISYLPRVWRFDKKKLIIEMLDSMIKRWKNKRDKTKDITTYSEQDIECEVKSVGIFMKELIKKTHLQDITLTKEDLIDNVSGLTYDAFFMHLIINVFFCKEIYDYIFYTYEGESKPSDEFSFDFEKKLSKLNSGTFMRLEDHNFIKDSLNDDNLVGISLVLDGHVSCIVKCSGSKYGNFNNYYDDNFEKLYTINYEEFRQTIINAKDLLLKPNTKLVILKPNGENVRVVFIDDNTGKIINRQTDSIKQKYLKYKIKYMKLKNLHEFK